MKKAERPEKKLKKVNSPMKKAERPEKKSEKANSKRKPTQAGKARRNIKLSQKPSEAAQGSGERISMDVGNYLAPVPCCMLSSGRPGERPNIMTVAWCGTVNSKPPMISVSITKSRYSHDLVSETGEFVLNITDIALAKACDYCGVKSFREVDKFAALGLTPEAIEGLDVARAIKEAPLSLGCKLRHTLELGSHDLFIAEIVSLRVRADLLDKKGALHLEKAGLLAYVHGQYFALGKWLGFFGWSVAAPSVLTRRQRESRRVYKKS